MYIKKRKPLTVKGLEDKFALKTLRYKTAPLLNCNRRKEAALCH